MTQEGKTKKIFDGRYEIVGIVGRGPCSVVYHARHVTPPTTDIALKVLTPDKSGISQSDRLRKEALAMISAKHRYVIGLQDYHSVGTLSYLAMDFAPESDLRSYLSKHGGKLQVPQGERFLLQATEALAAIHRIGITHRDIKPDNILVMNEIEIRLADFGVAILPGESSSIDELQRGVGTMDYMAPEVLESGVYDQSSDVYALALSFYEAFSGKHPLSDVSLMSQLDARRDGKIPNLASIEDVPLYLSAAIMKGLRYRSEDRFPTAREFLQAILLGKSGAIDLTPAEDAPVEELNPEVSPDSTAPDIAEEIEPVSEIQQAEPVEQEVAVASTGYETTSQVPEPVIQTAAPISDLNNDEEDPYLRSLQNNVKHPKSDDDTDTGSSGGYQLKGLTPKSSAPVNPFAVSSSVEESAVPLKGNDDYRGTVSVPPEDVGLIRQTHEDRMTVSLKRGEQSLSEGEIEGLNGKFSIRDEQRKSVKKDSSVSLLDRSTLKKAALGVLGIATIVFLTGVLFSGGKGPRTETAQETTKESTTAQIQDPALALEATVTFPNLPQGIYSGTISGLSPNSSSTLTMISLADQGSIGVIIGLPGFTPAQFKIPKDSGQKLRVSSNGLILDLTATVENGLLKGTFKNVVDGTTGAWSAKAISLGGA